MYGLALEGGGAKGSYEIGAYISLLELGYKFKMITGTSIGSLNAALIVQGDHKLAKNIWLSSDSEIIGLDKDIVETYKNFKFNKDDIKETIVEINKILKNKGLDVTNYKKIIDKYVDENRVRRSKINYGLVTFRVKDKKPLELTINDIEEGKLSEYILASSYLPVFKMDKIIDNSFYLDGAFSDNLPINLLEKNDCKDVIAIRIDGIGKIKKKLHEFTNIIEIKPTKKTGPIIMFDNNDIKNNYYMGYYDTYLKFNKLDGYKYYFKKFKYYKFITRKVSDKKLNLIKIRFRTTDIKEIILKSIENILENNDIYYYKVYSIPRIIRYIKKKKLISKETLINEIVYNLKYFY